MKYLLIDNSNTRTKFCLSDKTKLLAWQAWLPTDEINHPHLEEVIGDLAYDAVLLCSVVPAKAEIIRSFFALTKPFHQVTCDSILDLTIDYPLPRQIGADRLANAVGVVQCHTAPAIVIDFGTAVTFDVISAKPAYCGGVIAPGLGAMNDYLHRKTALLPLIELSEPKHAIGKSTDEAMRVGAVYGYRGLVKEILHQLLREISGDVSVIATGGDAALIAAGIDIITKVDPMLTQEGLRHLARRNL